MTVKRWEAIALASILAIALAVRIIGLNSSLWYDEVITLTHYIRQPFGQLVTEYSSLIGHPFYSLQARAAVAMFGESAWALRLPSLIFGLASIYVVWLMGRQAAGRIPALLAAFLLAIAYHHVWFSQNARGYTGALFWTSIATLLLLRGLHRPSWGVWTAYGLCVAAGMYSHLSVVLFYATHMVVYFVALVFRGSPGRAGAASTYPGLHDLRPLYGFALGGILGTALLLPVIRWRLQGAANELPDRVLSMNEWKNPFRTLQEIVSSMGDLGVFGPYILIGALAVIVVGAIAISRKSPLLVAIYALHVPLAIGVMLAFSFRIWPRYFLVDIGFIVLCVAAGAYELSNSIGRALQPHESQPVAANAVFVVAVLAISVVSVALLRKNYAYPKQDLAGAVALIEHQRVAGDVAASVGLAATSIHSYFAPSWPVVETPDQLQALLDSASSVWIVTAFPSLLTQRHGDVIALVNEKFDLVAKLPGTLADGTVRVYRSRRASPQ